MARIPKKTERNLALYNDFKLFQAGQMQMVDLMTKYNLSTARVYFLVKRVKKELGEE